MEVGQMIEIAPGELMSGGPGFLAVPLKVKGFVGFFGMTLHGRSKEPLAESEPLRADTELVIHCRDPGCSSAAAGNASDVKGAWQLPLYEEKKLWG
ncbi:hypothetical protein NQZ68_008194 [Dissostichus eleginoides]|nr:hypothetical protein NQZ68_008194 [Dissostichus eleginoides]